MTIKLYPLGEKMFPKGPKAWAVMSKIESGIAFITFPPTLGSSRVHFLSNRIQFVGEVYLTITV